MEPLRLSFVIRCPAAHAFEVWTTRLAKWWPRGHTASGDPDTLVVLEPRDGGRLYERTADGVEIDWGRITGWDPPRRLAYRWHIGLDASEATDVELTFVDLDDGSTRLDIVHAGWERLSADGPSRREANVSGWSAVLPAFTAAAQAGPPGP
jgi:uncharacterized protein YndB with AHSA1/START domain